jgi:hypothetical protein
MAAITRSSPAIILVTHPHEGLYGLAWWLTLPGPVLSHPVILLIHPPDFRSVNSHFSRDRCINLLIVI